MRFVWGRLSPRQVLTAFHPCTLQEIISLSIAALHGRPTRPCCVKHLYSRSPPPSLLLSVEMNRCGNKLCWTTSADQTSPCWASRLAAVLNVNHLNKYSTWAATFTVHWSNVSVQLTESLTNRVERINESRGVLLLQNWWTFISTHCLLDNYIKQRLVSCKSGKIITQSRLIDPYQPDISHKAGR